MKGIRRTCLVVIAIALMFGPGPTVEAQGPIRIGATLAQTGVYAALGQNQLRGYQLCVKHVNDKGGVLGRKLELVVYDDRSEPATGVPLYERLITQDKVDVILGPYSSPITEAVADVSEKYRKPMVAPTAALRSIYTKGRKFVFGMLPPAEGRLQGLLDLAVKKGLRTVAVINVDDLARRAGALGTIELAKQKGLQVVLGEAYPPGSTDFSAILTKVRAANPDVLVGSTRFDDAVAITRQMRTSDVNPRMYGLTIGVDSLKFYEALGRDAEFVYGVSPWLPELVDVRAGGLIPIARQYPGAREFVESYRKEFPGADLSYHAAAGYGGCEILVEAMRRAGSLDSERLRDAILKIDRNTVFGGFGVDRNGAPIARKDLMFQWQDGKKVIVWPEELAPGKPRFPTPPWKSTPVKQVSPACLAIIAIALVFGSVSIAGAQPPIRIGASLSQSGAYAAPGQNQLRGYRLCVKHTNDRGGLLGRRLELVVEDDRSEPATAVRIYEKLITQDKVNAVLSPYTSPIIDAVAEVSEKHRMPLVAFGAAASAVFKKGRKFLFMVQSPAEVWLEGFVELAARNGLRTIALIYEDSPFSRAAVKGASELARKRGLQVVFTEAYPTGNTEFAAILTRARSAIPDAFGAATRGLDAEAVTRQIKALDMNPKMYAVTIGGALPRFYAMLGRNAEFVYVPSEWEPELVTLRAEGLIPIARQYPGARELVEAHHREYPGADLSYHTAGGYGGCQVLAEAVKRAGSLDGAKIRDAILKLEFNTVFGTFRVDPDGLQIAHKLVLFQWQDGKKVIVWPEELAPGSPRFPTPAWGQRQ